MSTDLLPSALLEATLVELEDQDAGIKEYDLMQALKGHGFFAFIDDALDSSHALFQAHFLLYHVLYLLRDKLASNQQAWLKIEALDIQLLPYWQAEDSLAEVDKLRAYYLDLSNLENTTAEQVSELISSFWTKFTRHENRDEALAVLGLVDPVDNKLIKSTYRRLVMKSHPDRGGNKEQLQAMNSAINILLS